MNNVIKLAEKFEIKLANNSSDSLLMAYDNVYRQHLLAAMTSIQDAADILARLKESCTQYKSENTDSAIDERIFRLSNISDALQAAQDDIVYGIRPTFKDQMLKGTDE